MIKRIKRAVSRKRSQKRVSEALKKFIRSNPSVMPKGPTRVNMVRTPKGNVTIKVIKVKPVRF